MSKTIFKTDLKKKKMFVTREFAGTLEQVWQAWTDPKILDEWWGPKPWKAKNKKMDFREGGIWLYSMVGPDGTEHWSRNDYKKIIPYKSFEGNDRFCDEKGNKNEAFLGISNWKNTFSKTKNGTKVEIEITYASVADLKKMSEMGFEGGFSMGHNQLDEYLQAQFKLRTELKTNSGSRVCTYLNFPGNTEEAFNFYKSVFKTEFSRKGIQRFEDIPAEPGNPPIPVNIKKMILHVELTILGGHVLMATDAPKEMGMTLTHGNNMHINLEPETRKETKRIFDALSKGGKIHMPLEDMFFGAYFGELTDKFGINWMFHCREEK